MHQQITIKNKFVKKTLQQNAKGLTDERIVVPYKKPDE